MPNRRSLHRITLAAAAVIGVAVLAAPSAGAASTTHSSRSPQSTRELGKWTKKYSIGWTWKDRKLHLCIKFAVYGDITYKTYETVTTHAAQVWWKDQKLNDPTMHVVVENPTCKRQVSAGLHEVAISQHWTGYSCSFNPSLSIGVGADGVAIGIAGWPSCGNRTQVIYHSHYPRGSHHTQFNSASPTAFGNYSDPVTGVGLLFPPPCYGVYPSATIYYRANSDSFNSGNLAKAGKVCLSKYE